MLRLNFSPLLQLTILISHDIIMNASIDTLIVLTLVFSSSESVSDSLRDE